MKQKKISIKGILLGLLADWVISIGLGILIGIVAAVSLIIRNGMPDNPETFADSITTPGLFGISLVIAFSGTTLGGFITGKVAKRSEVLNASLMGLLSLLSAIPFMNGPVIYDVTGCGLTIPFAILGGYLASKKNMSSQKHQPTVKTPVESGNEQGTAGQL